MSNTDPQPVDVVDRIEQDVAQAESVEASASALISSLVTELRDAADEVATTPEPVVEQNEEGESAPSGPSPAQVAVDRISALADRLEAANTALSNAVVANTPASPEAAQAQQDAQADVLAQHEATVADLQSQVEAAGATSSDTPTPAADPTTEVAADDSGVQQSPDLPAGHPDSMPDEDPANIATEVTDPLGVEPEPTPVAPEPEPPVASDPPQGAPGADQGADVTGGTPPQ